ncbi:dienelactone hydrolase family protein [Cupriavidus numazuensis]|uniref:Phosphoribosyl transferase n=1 Tax=Cupriavidus numazuensis TaxID=221992 RepID=A0ABM8TUX6_9BURK|nr:alpha/beta hydrolase [Cupriavidus numazuensis]CAG2160420.1 Putative phosphoribosyl transferase [Cupriavidus numazuensis]
MRLVAVKQVVIQVDNVALQGELTLPETATGLVLFAQVSGASGHTSRNRLIALMLNDVDIGTLLFDLLIPDEIVEPMRRFDIGLLCDRLRAATKFVEELARERRLRLGYFGSGTGAAAAMRAAAAPPGCMRIDAVVSRSGRIDLAGHEALSELTSPLLMIVGEADPFVLNLNVHAAARVTCKKRLEVIPGATNRFEEPGAMERVGKLAIGWFQDRFV